MTASDRAVCWSAAVRDAVARRVEQAMAELPPLTDEGRREAAAIFCTVPQQTKRSKPGKPAA